MGMIEQYAGVVLVLVVLCFGFAGITTLLLIWETVDACIYRRYDLETEPLIGEIPADSNNV